ncbi:MAG: murein L,D-transpeptidase family protein, partial [Rhodothermales bacterium]
MKKRALTLLLAAVVLLALVALYRYGRGLWYPVYLKVKGKRTVAEAVERYAPGAIARLKPYFEQASIAFLPQEITLLAMKEERQLELWARDAASAFTFIRSYPIRAASGDLGPKLREGDRQVPEGMYRIVALNPNSRYHLSMKLNYPNAFDLHHAEREGRTAPGSDIFIHGKAVSIGCLAMGDPAIEELFVLV